MSEPGNITLWMPETDQHLLATLGKLAEEANELAGRCARSIIQGVNELDPESGRTNLEELQREIADVLACISQAEDRLGLHIDANRRDAKDDGFDMWHRLIDDELAIRDSEK